MKKILKFELALAISILFIASALGAMGTTLKTNSMSISTNKEIINQQIIAVPDSTILLKLWEEQNINGEVLPFYSISLDNGETYVRTVQASYELGLRYEYFDPLEYVPTVESNLAADDDVHLFIVQFVTQPLGEFKDAIMALGGEVRHYIAQFAYLVEMNQEVKSEVELLPYVRWIGPYQPAYRLEEYMLDNLENAEQMYPLQHYNIQVLAVEQKDIVANRIVAIGGILNRADAGKKLVEATLTPDQLFEIVRWDEVNFVDRWGPMEPDMNIAREIGGANYIETVAGYDGSGVRGEVFDVGFNLNHVDFASRPLILHGQVSGDSHGAATSGICFGDGTGNSMARGLLPAGQGIVADCDYVGLSGPSRYAHTGELVQDPYYAVFQTSSVGSPRTTQYTTVSADSDEALFDFDIVHCQSQSNAGTQMSRPQAWAKNIISGGGVYHYDTIEKSDDCWCYGASIGPASDGRIKPTFTYFYDNIYTVGYPGANDYTQTFGGTSGATPIIAGHVGLFFEMWSDGIFGNEVDPNGTVFENRAHMTTAKAMLINSADQYQFSGTSHDKTRMHQGWGMPNVKNLYNVRNKIYVIDETDVIEPFNVSQHTVWIGGETSSLKATMTYADPPGNPSVQSQHRVNDLTLKAISPSGTIYWGNNGLLESIWSSPDGDPDTKNTVECVFVQSPESGAWTIEVHADEIMEDSHVETPELDADYALVISPVIMGPSIPEITGPTEGEMGEEYYYTFTSTDPDSNDLYYYIDWGDGNTEEWIGPYSSGVPIAVNHTWDSQGIFEIKAKAKNIFNAESSWSAPYNMAILSAPNAPTITGEINGIAGTEYEYTFVAIDLESDDVSYYIEWGDNTSSGWTEYFASGNEITLTHVWNETGTYTIQAKAKDVYEAESDWGTLDVTMPLNQQSSQQFIVQLFNKLFQRMFTTI